MALWAIRQLYLQLIQGLDPQKNKEIKNKIQGLKNYVCAGWEIFATNILEFYLEIMCLVLLLIFIKIMILKLIVVKVASFTGKEQTIISYKKFVLKAYSSGVQEGLASGFGLGTVMLVVFCTGERI